MLEPLSPLPENLEESAACVDQMDVRNITEASVGSYDAPQVCGIDTTYVENILSGTDAIET